MFFQHVWTKDEHDAENPVKPYPIKEKALRLLIHRFSTMPMLWVVKSRQLMVTWTVCAYLLWAAKRHPYRLIFAQSKKEADAANLVFNGGKSGKDWFQARISFIEKHLPPWLQDEGIQASYAQLVFPNGSKIWGIPEGPDIIRSYTASVLFSDEAAFQPSFEAAYTAALPMIKGGGQFIAVSSANPGFFEKMVER